MATANDLIRRALRLIGVLATGEHPDANQAADALESLNSMIDSWRNESFTVFALRTEQLAITGAASYTIGPTGTLNTVRPVRIDSAFWREGTTDYPLRQAQSVPWSRIADKTTTGTPDLLYYEPAVPLGVIYLHPIPTAGTLHLVTLTPISEFALSDAVTLPPGYREAIAYQLAMRLAPEYGVSVPVEVAAMGKSAKADIRRTNYRAPIMNSGVGVGRLSDIVSGE